MTVCDLCEENESAMDFNCPVEYPKGSGELVMVRGDVCIDCYGHYSNDLFIALGLLKKGYNEEGYESHEEYAAAIKEEKHKPIVAIR